MLSTSGDRLFTKTLVFILFDLFIFVCLFFVFHIDTENTVVVTRGEGG